MPTLALIVTVLGYSALDPAMNGAVVRRSFFHIAFYLSFSYLVVTYITILVQPLTPGDPVELMHMSNLSVGSFSGARRLRNRGPVRFQTSGSGCSVLNVKSQSARPAADF